MAYYTDINNYVIVRTSSIEDFGAISGGNPVDNFNAIQAAIDSDYRVLFFGNSTNENYTVSQPLYLRSNKTYFNKTTLQVKDGSTANLTADIVKGQTSFTVDSVAGFSVGEWISVTDNNQVYLYQTYRAWSGRIVDITGLTITLDGGASYNYTASAGGRIGHTQGVMYAELKTKIKIEGHGIIDGNRYNQSQFHPVYGSGPAEDQRATSALCLWACTDSIINNVTVTKGILHSLSITGGDDDIGERIELNNVKATFGHDKSCLVRLTTGLVSNDCVFEDATWEDGMICYSSVNNAIFNNPVANRNKRYGLAVNSSISNNITFNNPVTRDNYEHGINLAGNTTTINNGDSNDPLWISGAYSGNGNVINGMVINGCDTSDHISTRGVVWCYYQTSNIRINDLIITNCKGTAIKSSAAGGIYPQDVIFEGGGIYNHTGTKTDIAVGSDITFINFEGLT